MMPSILIGGIDASGNKVDLAYIDYGGLMTRSGTVADVKLPEKLEPRAYPDGMFGFDFARVNPGPIGVDLNADELQQAWQKLEDEGMSLAEVTLGFIVMDIIESIREIPAKTPGYVHYYYGVLPSFAWAVQLVGHIAEIRAFPQDRCYAFEGRVSELRRNLKGIVKHGGLSKKPWPELSSFLGTVTEAGKAITSKESEFNVLKQLLKSDHICRLSKSGADFKVVDQNGLRAEVKSRHENILKNLIAKGEAQGIIGPNEISILPGSFLAFISWASFATIRRAMETQKSQVLFCDLSHTFAGWMLPAVEQLWKMNLSFKDAVEEAFRLAARGKQAIVVFASLPGPTHYLQASTFERDAVEPLGKLLWDMNKQLSLHSPELARLLGNVFKQELE